MTRGTRLKWQQLEVIIISWLIMAFLVALYEHFGLHSNNSLGPSEQYSFLFIVVRNLTGAFFGALVGGSFLVFYVNVKYQDKPYAYTILAVTLAFILIISIITIMIGLVMVPLQTGLPLSNPESRALLKKYILDGSHFQAIMVWSFVVAITQLLLQVNSKFGQSNFWNIIRGKYNRAKKENRIFMFLDLNSSTAIAEQLGDSKYHGLLKDFFTDITTPIINNKGNIYQYVGDEVVVTWTYADGKENFNCLSCIFDMKRVIQEREEKYKSRYGLAPSFKAGIHCGSVIAGEVGIIKREITYSGNVLNTTSRILGKCAEYHAQIIASEALLRELQVTNEFITRPLGAIRLKGKRKEVRLFEVVPG